MRVVKAIFDWRLHGIRVINIFCMVCLVAMVFSVYIAKTNAAGQSQKIGELEHKIAAQSERVRLLRAEAARLESPARLEQLSRDAGLLPPEVDRVTTEDGLTDLAPQSNAAPAAVDAVDDVAVSPDDMAVAAPAEAPR